VFILQNAAGLTPHFRQPKQKPLQMGDAKLRQNLAKLTLKAKRKDE
jgi:hypothetical protein